MEPGFSFGAPPPKVPDGQLDRHYGFATYIGSGAWEASHQSENIDDVHWSYFVKIVAVPASAHLITDAIGCPTALGLDGARWFIDNTEIGCSIWGAFATIRDV